MSKIETVPVPDIVIVSSIASEFEEVLAHRNSFSAEDTSGDYSGSSDLHDKPEIQYGVSKSIVLPSDFIPNEQARYDIGREHVKHLGTIKELGIDLGNLPKLTITGNTLTEKNLPQYQTAMMEKLWTMAGREDNKEAMKLLMDWVRTWTAEESSHEVALRDAGLATRVVDPRQLDLASIKVAKTPLGLEMDGIVELWSYLTLQEAATVVSHRNTGALFGPTVRKMMKKVSANESTHEIVNSELIRMSLEIDADRTVTDFCRQIRNFSMPGKEGIPFFKAYAQEMAISGIFGTIALRKLARDKAEQLIKVDRLDLSPQVADDYGRLMAEELNDKSDISIRRDGRIDSIRQRRIDRLAKNGMVPFILGITVVDRAGLQRIA